MVYFWATFILNRNRTVKNQKSTSQQTFTNNPSQAFATHKSDFKSLLHTPPPFQPTPPEKNESSYMPHTLSRDMSEDEQVGQRHTTSIQPSLETRLRLHEMIDDKGDVSTSKRESKMTIMSTESFELTFSPLMTLLDIEADDEIETVQYNGV